MTIRRDAAVSTDFLVIGSGIAGLRAAIALAPIGRVTILTKDEPTESNTGYAQGGIAAAMGDDDSPALHAADTLNAGDGLCDESAVQVLVSEGPVYVRELIEWGVRFDREPDGRLALGREAAHTVRRVLHAGDATGREIGRALWLRASGVPAISTVTHALVTGLRIDDGVVTGARYFDRSGTPRAVAARATLLATGGAGRVFRETTNPPVATGDGVALAYHAGARTADLEFVQFHPTAFSLPGAPRFLISEALRGEGGRIVNGTGERFMLRYHPSGDLAPRDVVARGMVSEMERTGSAVFLTMAHLDPECVRRRFPWITDMCRQYGFDLGSDLIPVAPAAHYMMGGIDTDEWGRSSLPGLYAAGEVACTGVHGANRLASNSLLEGLVFGARAAIKMPEPPRAAVLKADRKIVTDPVTSDRLDVVASPVHAAVEATPVEPLIRDILWEKAGLFRTRDGLQSAISVLERLRAAARSHVLRSADDVGAWRAFNLATVASLIASAALRRDESRGGHYRLDAPARDDERWRWHACDVRAADSVASAGDGD